MSAEILHSLSVSFFVLTLAVFIGFEVVSKVPTTLHTPLMSGSNAISGVILLGALMVAAQTKEGTPAQWLALGAIVLGSINVVGGFVVTDRMLGMFKKKKKGGNK
ncbi:MAG: NAD(P) transhydrogenase subunit alpha [Deltaproteobacteria bacterium]|nr:NAD(P) transhydrogenase subunit alpha [Deltaproteobacteria bacterium]